MYSIYDIIIEFPEECKANGIAEAQVGPENLVWGISRRWQVCEQYHSME